MKENLRLYAFWRYDRFPFVRGGEIGGWCPHDWPGQDHIHLKNSPGYFYKPIKIVPLTLGLKIQKTLDQMEAEREQGLNAVYSNFNQKLKELFPEFKIK